MRKFGTRIISMLLTIALMLGMLPMSAMAALLDNSSEYNQQILSELKQVCGSEEEAERYYGLLQQYGLLDEDGNAVESWAIRMDGEDITLEELREVLAGDYDPAHYISVDGEFLTLKDVATILEIEDYIAYLRDTYYSGGEWTAEQKASLQSLLDQVNSEGIMLLSADSGTLGASGVNHAARVSVSGPVISDNGSTASFTATLTDAAEGQTVTFDWTALSGSQTVSGGGTVTFTGNDTQTFAVTLDEVSTDGEDPVRSSAALSYFVKLDSITNALFSGDKDAMTLACTTDATVETMPSGTFDTQYINNLWAYEEGKTHTEQPIGGDGEQNAVRWGIADTAVAMNHSPLDENAFWLIDNTAHSYESVTLATSLSDMPSYITIKDVTYNATIGNLQLNTASFGCYWLPNTDTVNSDDLNEPLSNYLEHRAVSQTKKFQFADTGYDDTDNIEFIVDYSVNSSNIELNGKAMMRTDRNASADDLASFGIFIHFSDEGAPKYVKATAPSATYYPGQTVPVTVTFSEPVEAGSAYVRFNGGNTNYSAVETGGYSNVLTFLYTVQETDNTGLSLSYVHAEDTTGGKGHTLDVNPGGDTVTGALLDDVDLSTPIKSHAVTGMSAAVTDAETAEPKLTVSVSIASNNELTQWIEPAAEGDRFYANGLTVSLDGGKTMHNLYYKDDAASDGLTATIPLDVSANAVTHVAELYIDGTLVVGKTGTATQTAAKFITEDDLTLSEITVKNADDTPYQYSNDEKTIFLQGASLKIQAGYTLTGSGYSFASADQFEWRSNDTAVANIDATTGTITPTGKSGSVTFTLKAKNGGIEGKAVEKTTPALTFNAGLTPFLTIPNNALTASDQQDVTLYWTSNLCEKNVETSTEFTVTVQRAGTDDNWTEKVSGTATAPKGSVTIPGSFLTYDYDDGNNTFDVTVSASYGGKDYTANATISLDALPAQVKFEKLASYYILDNAGSVSIPWSVTSLDRADTVDQDSVFKFQITQNSTDIPTNVTLDLNGGKASGTYQLEIRDVVANDSDPSSYRDIYTVTIQAKNGTDSTWSYDSFLLYVYDRDALQIMVDGSAKDSVTMSNESKIAKMSQEEILALKRDIYLKNVISANYGTYAWTEVADQIAWKSNDNSVATVNYQQGSLYENIENFTYTSYRPTTDFMLSGIRDGTTSVTATHKLTGMEDTLGVTVETLTNKLYLFQCYPQVKTKLTFTNGAGQSETIYSDDTGAAAYYHEKGIASDVYCQTLDKTGAITTEDGNLYVGTYYLSTLKTGEQDAATMTLYPCNNLQLRRAAYAYLYVKNPDGTPYTGSITFRGGVYVNDVYKESALFKLDDSGSVNLPGSQDQKVQLGEDGKLTVTMDQQQWGLANNMLSVGDKVQYVFQIEQSGGTAYYPMLLSIDATANEDAYVGSGESIVNFRKNTETREHAFVAAQGMYYTGQSRLTNLLGDTGRVGPSDSLTEANLVTTVMWWGEQADANAARVTLRSSSGVEIAPATAVTSNTAYPFSDVVVTQYSVKLNNDSIQNVCASGKTSALRLDYYCDGAQMTRQEDMSFTLCNMVGVGKVENSSGVSEMIASMGNSAGTSASSNDDISDLDEFVGIAMNLVASDDYSKDDEKLFQIRLSPTSDPTKFMGLIQVNVGGLENDPITDYGVSGPGEADTDYTPGLFDTIDMAKGEYLPQQQQDYDDAVLGGGDSGPDKSFAFSGYAESLVYYNYGTQRWEVQILDGGFKAGGGLEYEWTWNFQAGVVPLTTSLSIGGTVEIGMDALTVAYYDKTTAQTGLGNDFLTELRVYMYLKFFAGVGVDYSVVAFKLGIYGKISLDMQFQWLNRPYMYDQGSNVVNVADGGTDGTLNGQHFQVDGEIGMEMVVKFLFFSFEKVLFSYSFNLGEWETGQWSKIDNNWTKNKAALDDTIAGLLNSGNASVQSAGGRQMVSLNLATTLEDRSYLESEDFYRQWGDGGFSLFSLDTESALKNLESSTYPYANPVVSDDGQLVAYLSDQASSNAEDTRAAFATLSGDSYANGGFIQNDGYGDSQLSLAGTEDFAVAAWTRQTKTVEKDKNENDEIILTADDQMVLMNSTETYAAVYVGSNWAATRLSENSSPDMAPVVATNGERAIVAWRSVATSSDDVTDFNQKDTIVYKIYDGSNWSDSYTLYNGTSGNVKALTAAMLADGTAAVAYTLDTDKDTSTTADREIVYSVIGAEDNDVIRNVQATTDGYLDENPQLTAVTFNSDDERFVLGWYTEQSVAKDSAAVLDGGTTQATASTVSDIRLLDFDAEGVSGQKMPDSISQAAASTDVAITSNFRFTKSASTIEDLSIIWAERTNSSAVNSEATDYYAFSVEKDVLKGIKFYQDGASISFTGAVDVAEMPAATLIDHFDAYVSDAATNEIKAVILGTTYGNNGTINRTVTLADNETTAEITVPSKTYTMYTATETYADKIAVPAVVPDYSTVKKGATTQIQFTVKNNGIHAIDTITIAVDGTKTAYPNLNLLPGKSVQLAADYAVPQSGVVDPTYTVQANFTAAGASGEATTTVRTGWRSTEDLTTVSDTLYLNLPDVEITEAKIVDETAGKRTIQLKLNNTTDAALEESEKTVRVNFYSDATHENPITSIGENGSITIKENADLKAIDEGGYSKQVTFDVAAYVRGTDDAKEIPENGVKVYLQAEIVGKNEGEEYIQSEPISSNNAAVVSCDNLKTRTGSNVIITSSLSNTENSGSTVAVKLQNTRLTQTTTGNVIVALLDESGHVLEQKQSYTGQGSDFGLLTLAGEGKAEKTFAFSKKGASVQVTYSDLIINADNANLTSLTFSGIPVKLEDFKLNQKTGMYEYAVSTDDLTSTLVTATTETPLAKVYIADESGSTNFLNESVTLKQGETTKITVTVNSKDKMASKTYVLTVQNNGDPVINWPNNKDAQNTQYGTSVYYSVDNSATINLSAAAVGEYELHYQWYSCNVEGKALIMLDDQTASTLTIPAKTNSGTYYYICKVTRPLIDGKTRDYWSSVATVQINPATSGNYVVLTDTEVDFNNQPHGLTSATAAQTGSTIYYTTSAPTVDTEWTTKAPTFTAVGIHTVWAYATNDNYENTDIVTANVVIKAVESTKFKLETTTVENAFNSYPKAITDKFANAAALEAFLKTEVTALGTPEDNTAIYDVALKFSLDGKTWQIATADNFPGAIRVKLDYPMVDGKLIDRTKYNFTLIHLIADPLSTGKNAGDTEIMDLTLEEDGIYFTATCLSPFVLGWRVKPTDSRGETSSYAVAVKSAEHGTVKANQTQAASGTTVTITATPDEGYMVNDVSVTTSTGRKLTVKQGMANTYTFTMPSSAVSVQVSFAAQDTWKNPFKDVPDSAYYSDAVKWAVEKGVTSGTTATTFAPNDSCTRGQTVTFLWRAMGSPEPTAASNPFTDVSADAYYYKAVLWAVENGITNGTGATTFAPDMTVSRAQVATFLWRAAGTPAATTASSFTDVPTDAYYAAAVLWAAENGITSGTNANTFSPIDPCTRGQIATFLYRYSGK